MLHSIHWPSFIAGFIAAAAIAGMILAGRAAVRHHKRAHSAAPEQAPLRTDLGKKEPGLMTLSDQQKRRELMTRNDAFGDDFGA